jgi:hypothetical protein
MGGALSAQVVGGVLLWLLCDCERNVNTCHDTVVVVAVMLAVVGRP